MTRVQYIQRAQSRRVLAGVLTVKLVSAKSTQSHGRNKEDANESPETTKARIVKRGAQLALTRLGGLFGPELFTRLKQMWDSMVGGLTDAFGEGKYLCAWDIMGLMSRRFRWRCEN